MGFFSKLNLTIKEGYNPTDAEASYLAKHPEQEQIRLRNQRMVGVCLDPSFDNDGPEEAEHSDECGCYACELTREASWDYPGYHGDPVEGKCTNCGKLTIDSDLCPDCDEQLPF